MWECKGIKKVKKSEKKVDKAGQHDYTLTQEFTDGSVATWWSELGKTCENQARTRRCDGANTAQSHCR